MPCTAAARWPCCTRWACPTGNAATSTPSRCSRAAAAARTRSPPAGWAARWRPAVAACTDQGRGPGDRGPAGAARAGRCRHLGAFHVARTRHRPGFAARDALPRLIPPWLRPWLARAALRAEPGMADGLSGRAGAGRNAAQALAAKAAEFLQRGSQVAVLEMGGWDSHANQAAPTAPRPTTCARWTPRWRHCTRACRPAACGSAASCWWPPNSAARSASTARRAPTMAAAVRPSAGRRSARRPGGQRLAGPGGQGPLRGPRPAHHHRPARRLAQHPGPAPAGAAGRTGHQRAAGQRHTAAPGLCCAADQSGSRRSTALAMRSAAPRWPAAKASARAAHS
jgi:hypothetical protein